jgi:hypothetical protein
MSMAQFWFNFNNAWSGQKYYTEGSIQFYNLMYTSLPILLLGKYYQYSMVYVCVFVCFSRCQLLVALEAVILYAFYNYVLCVTYCPTQDNQREVVVIRHVLDLPHTLPLLIPVVNLNSTLFPLFYASFSPRPYLLYPIPPQLLQPVLLPLLYIFSYLFSTPSLPY